MNIILAQANRQKAFQHVAHSHLFVKDNLLGRRPLPFFCFKLNIFSFRSKHYKNVDKPALRSTGKCCSIAARLIFE